MPNKNGSKNVKNLTLCSTTDGASTPGAVLHSGPVQLTPLFTPWTPLFYEALESTTDRLQNGSPSSVASSGSSPNSVDFLDEYCSPSARLDLSFDEKTPRVGSFPKLANPSSSNLLSPFTLKRSADSGRKSSLREPTHPALPPTPNVKIEPDQYAFSNVKAKHQDALVPPPVSFPSTIPLPPTPQVIPMVDPRAMLTASSVTPQPEPAPVLVDASLKIPRPPKSDMIKAVKAAKEAGREFPVPKNVLAQAGVGLSLQGTAENEREGLPAAQADVSKLISLLWKNETKEVKKKYDDLSVLRKQEHAVMYPNYKFQPMKKPPKGQGDPVLTLVDSALPTRSPSPQSSTTSSRGRPVKSASKKKTKTLKKKKSAIGKGGMAESKRQVRVRAPSSASDASESTSIKSTEQQHPAQYQQPLHPHLHQPTPLRPSPHLSEATYWDNHSRQLNLEGWASVYPQASSNRRSKEERASENEPAHPSYGYQPHPSEPSLEHNSSTFAPSYNPPTFPTHQTDVLGPYSSSWPAYDTSMGAYVNPNTQPSRYPPFDYASQARAIPPSDSEVKNFFYSYASGSTEKAVEVSNGQPACEEIEPAGLWHLVENGIVLDHGASGDYSEGEVEEAFTWYTEGVWEVDETMQVEPQQGVTFSLTNGSW